MVGSDPQHPGRDGRFFPEVLEVLDQAEEGLLGDVFGIVRLAEDPASYWDAVADWLSRTR